VILIRRLGLTTQLAENLANRTAKLDDIKATPLIAREKWRSAFKDRKAIRECLALMALGVQRCMYCGDNLGTDIDHFEPISDAPLRTFDWLNHILACSFCNSNQKRDAFPRDRSGQSC
jgi:5-methylcytosine-specific restriction endonuclease McrA